MTYWSELVTGPLSTIGNQEIQSYYVLRRRRSCKCLVNNSKDKSKNKELYHKHRVSTTTQPSK